MKLRTNEKGILLAASTTLLAVLASRTAGAAPWEPPTPADLEQLVEGRDWPIVMALAIGFIVRQLKEDARFPITVPKRLLPLVPGVLGLLSGLAEMLIKDVPWRAALAGAVVSAALPMLGHDVIAKGILRRDIPLGPLAKRSTATPRDVATDVGAETLDEEIVTPIVTPVDMVPEEEKRGGS